MVKAFSACRKAENFNHCLKNQPIAGVQVEENLKLSAIYSAKPLTL